MHFNVTLQKLNTVQVPTKINNTADQLHNKSKSNIYLTNQFTNPPLRTLTILLVKKRTAPIIETSD